jgi:hypothetical protein
VPETLKPLSRWDAAFRGRFETEHGGHAWTVDVDFLDFRERVRLYRDGDLAEAKKSPASFELEPGVRIEAAMGALGMRRIELTAGGNTSLLRPSDGTLEAWRLRVARDRPLLSTAIGAASWLILVVALVVGLGELAGLIGIDWPLKLPAFANGILGGVALAAALERALRFKSNPWLD